MPRSRASNFARHAPHVVAAVAQRYFHAPQPTCGAPCSHANESILRLGGAIPYPRLLPPVSCSLVTRCRVPANLDTVTAVGAEADPHSVGLSALAVERIWASVERLYLSGVHPAIQLCIRRRGEVVLDRAIGHTAGNGPDDADSEVKTLVTTETPICIFSASKAVTAMLIHLLDERGLIRLDDPVCEYIPEFSVRSKQWITIRHLLIHRAGIPNPPADVMDVDLLSQPDEIIRVLCGLPQTWRPGRQLAYHAITGGFLLAEVIRRVTGRDIRQFLDEEIRRPLGFRYFNYGVAPADVPHVARSYFTGPPPIPPLAYMLQRALGLDFREVIRISNDARFLTTIVPAGNVVATANEMSRFFQLLLGGGELDGVRVFSPRTIRRATVEQSYFEIDWTLALPFRYSMGFMLGAELFSLYGPDTRFVYGHLGFTNVVVWADPERELAAALLTTGKPTLYLEILDAWNIMRTIAAECSKTPAAKYSPAITVRRTAAAE